MSEEGEEEEEEQEEKEEEEEELKVGNGCHRSCSGKVSLVMTKAETKTTQMPSSGSNGLSWFMNSNSNININEPLRLLGIDNDDVE